MDASHRTQSHRSQSGNSHHHVGRAASELLKESKKMANGMYQQGVDKVCHVQGSIKGYSHDVANHVHEKPLLSLLIAGSIGFILSSLFRR